MSDIPRSILGRTGIEVSRLGYGSMELRFTGNPNRPELDESAAGVILNQALDSGITYFDTSPTYGPAEELIGKFISGRREEFTLSTKTGFVVEEFPARRHSFTREVVRRGLEWSLRRLKTEYVDLVQLPGSPSPAELMELDTLQELEAMQAEGKCRFIGISGWLPALRDHLNWGAFDVYQIPFSALERDNETIIGESARANIGTVVRGGVAQGSVSGEKRLNIDDDRHVGDRVDEKSEAWDAAGLDDLLDGSSRSEFMIRYLLSNPNINTSIIGTSNMTHLLANISAAQLGPLSPEVYARAQNQLDGK